MLIKKCILTVKCLNSISLFSVHVLLTPVPGVLAFVVLGDVWSTANSVE